VDANAATEGGWPAHMWAASNGRAEAVCVLLADPRVDVDAVAERGTTALRVAREGGHAAIAALLEEADPRRAHAGCWCECAPGCVLWRGLGARQRSH
jgi:ankyrin repeat protein